ncbi:HAMP domain-containing histidine kinase [Candidatus Kaiserbacteria bacterium]|nr:HAMP domain-containing histidine kinase [Candidatus Kaiserbacteria bacterium]
MRETAEAYWKQFAESATGLVHRYRFDPFFRTEVNVLTLQVAFAFVMLGIFGIFFNFLYHNIATAIVEGIRAAIASGTVSSLGPAIVAQIEQIKNQNLYMLVGIMTVATVFFGYIVARVTLSPARNALASQKQFIGNIAHELRTPLSVIKTNTEVSLLDPSVTLDMRETLLSNIEEMDRISEIINNLLSLSALVRPERIEFSPVDLSLIADETIQKFAPLAKSNGHHVTLRKSPEALVWGNATALRQIVGNLIKNALTYTPPGGTVRVTVEPTLQHSVELVVQDSGVGIARKDLFRIFEPFYRGDPSRTKSQGGSGLGLAIVSELIKLHQGRINIKSAVGRGTTVSVFFPAVADKGVVGNEADHKSGLNEIAVDFSKI